MTEGSICEFVRVAVQAWAEEEPDRVAARRPDGTPVTVRSLLAMIEAREPAALNYVQDIHGAMLRAFRRAAHRERGAALCYLSTEGVVRVPQRIREVLGLPHGGGVVFLEQNGRVEVVSDDEFVRRFETKRGSE